MPDRIVIVPPIEVVSEPRVKLECGHPTELLVRSTESDYAFCELCEARSERNDALTMEEHLGARVRVLEEALKPFAEFAKELFARNYNRSDRLMSIGDADLHLSVGAFFDAHTALVRALPNVPREADTPQAKSEQTSPNGET